MTPVVCSIGSTDPWNAAGLGLDILALTECGVRPVTVVAGVTAQDAGGIAALQPVGAATIAAQFASLRAAGASAYRVGALLSYDAVIVVAAHLADRTEPVVLDPVLGASGGGAFASEAVRDALVARLLPRVTLLTPNLAEASALAGMPVRNVAEMEAAAVALRARGAGAVLVKGGHLDPDDDARGRTRERSVVADVLVDDAGTVVFEDARLPGTLRGTGCLVACAAAAALARDEGVRDAVAYARAFVRGKFATGRATGGMILAY